MTGVSVKAERRPIFDKAEDVDKAYKQQIKICARGQGQNARQCTRPSITNDHARNIGTYPGGSERDKHWNVFQMLLTKEGET